MIDALLHREHTPYREIGHRSVAHVMERAGITFTMDEVRYLVGEIEKLKPFPEVPDALARLQTRYRLVVLSNGDPGNAIETARQFHKVPFDRVISVAEANSFKPHVTATYATAAELLGLKPDHLLFVANPCLPVASARNPPACAPPSSTATAAAIRHHACTSRTSWISIDERSGRRGCLRRKRFQRLCGAEEKFGRQAASLQTFSVILRSRALARRLEGSAACAEQSSFEARKSSHLRACDAFGLCGALERDGKCRSRQMAVGGSSLSHELSVMRWRGGCLAGCCW